MPQQPGAPHRVGVDVVRAALTHEFLHLRCCIAHLMQQQKLTPPKGLDPGEHIALNQLHMTPDTDAAWTLAVDTSVGNGRDRHPEVLRQVLNAEQRVEPTEWMLHGVP